MESLIEGQTASVPRADAQDKSNGTISWSSNLMNNNSTRIWNSRLSWKIVLAVFLTIMAVQASMLALTLKNYQTEQLNDLRTNALSIIAPLLASKVPNALISPIDKDQQQKVTSITVINGMAIYSTDYNLLSLSGEPVVLTIMNENDLEKTYLSQDKNNYEVVFRPRDFAGRPYYIVCRLDSTKITEKVTEYVRHSIEVMILLSAFVTTILMIALGKLLLEPIMFLRDNLSSAIANPESPNILRSPYDTMDDIGKAIHSAQELIRQNAKNLRQVKTTAQSQIHKLAYYDSLTGLPNRILFVQKLSEMTKMVDDSIPRRSAVLTIDLDHFKDINDTMGHSAGDVVLQSLASRLRGAGGGSLIACRSQENIHGIPMPDSTPLHYSPLRL